MITTLTLIALYVLNFFINRWININIQRNDLKNGDENTTNPIGILMCLLGIFGTIVLILIYILSINADFFKPKEMRKKTLQEKELRNQKNN